MKPSLVLLILLVFASQLLVAETFLIGEGYATSSSTESEESVVSAYRAALETEKAGANVSSLLVKLNEAAKFLASGRMSNGSADFDEATRIAREVENAAVELKDSALSEGLQRMVFTMTASVVGMALIALGSLVVWRLLKNRYRTNTLQK